MFSGLHLDVRAGQLLWVRGPNGQGKTSLLRLMAGLSQAEQGQVLRYAPVAFLGHQNALKDDLTVEEALGFLIRLQGHAPGASVLTQALGRMGMLPRRHQLVRTLSQGQRRRTALARLLLSPPGCLWILDEPFDALDDQGVSVLQEMIATHRMAGGSVALTSHSPVTLPDTTVLDLAAGAQA